MTSSELRKKYLEFFKSKGHAIIPSASLIPENDPSVLFTTAGMHPLVPYLLGEKHPEGKRLADVQKCIRTGDIDDVGDNRHLTFFEMMGNWSLGDYFKKEAIEWSWEFLTDSKWLGLDPKRIYVTTFGGEDGIPRDDEAIKIWQEVLENSAVSNGVAENGQITEGVRIIPLGKEDNFWIAGETGPCGGDTEMFYDTRPEEGLLEGDFETLVKSFRIIEIWNDVFMEFTKTENGEYVKLSQQNVDTGMGVERTLAVLNNKASVFETDLFTPLFTKIEELSEKKYNENEEINKSYRVIADHMRASVFMINDGATPSNTLQGYVLRRLIRRSIVYGRKIGITSGFTGKIAEVVIDIFKDFYTDLEKNQSRILEELNREEMKFEKTIENGLRELRNYELRIKNNGENKISGKIAFDLFQSCGLPIEVTKELVTEDGLEIDEDGFREELKKHQELSRTASAGAFKGGLADASEETIKLHTTAHLLLVSLRKVLGEEHGEINQKGSNITAERLRFDFNYPDKLTPEQIEKVEALVNEKINEELEVEMMELSLDEARKIGATGVFSSKYGDRVKVYKIGDYSLEICGGPHVKNTKELGHFKIIKEEKSSAGVRRIKGVLG